MIKVDIVNEVSRVADITKVKAEVAVDAVFEAMRISMQRGERIELRGFGVFQVKPRKRGIGRNPRTGKEVRIPPGPHHPLQARQRSPEYRRLTVFPPPAFPYRRFQHRWWRHILLFLLTVGTTTDVGVSYYLSFLSELATHAIRVDWTIVVHGMVYSAAVLGILGAHEMGHYLACRYYNLDATLPFFLPFPLLSCRGRWER